MKTTDAQAAIHIICKRMHDTIQQNDKSPEGQNSVMSGIVKFMGDMTALATTLAVERDRFAMAAIKAAGVATELSLREPLLSPGCEIADMTNDDLETLMRLAQAELDKRCRVRMDSKNEQRQ